MSFVRIISLLAVFGLKFATSASVISANPRTVQSPTVFDASRTANSLNEHLASIVKSAVPNSKINTTVSLVPLNPSPTVGEANDDDSNTDLKTDASRWHQYGRYRYPPFYRPLYYPYYWPYGQYNHPYYQHRYPTYNYYGQYYTGQNYYNPYRPYRPSYQRPSYQRPSYQRPPYRPIYRPQYRPSYQRPPYRRPPYPNYYRY